MLWLLSLCAHADQQPQGSEEKRPVQAYHITVNVSPTGDHSANIATTRLYDRRQSRPEESPTFKVEY